MPVPSTGWLGTPQNQDPVGFTLPVAQTGTYFEGGAEIVAPGGAPSVTAVSVGGVSTAIQTGDDINFVDTMLLTLTRTQVFGVLLVDSFMVEDLPEPPVPPTVCFPVEYTVPGDPEHDSCDAPTAVAVSYACNSGPAAENVVVPTASTPSFEEPDDPDVMVLGDQCIPHGTFGG